MINKLNTDIPCATCGFLHPPNQMSCARCGRNFTRPVNPFEDDDPGDDASRSNQPGNATFGLASILLMITLISICLALFITAPGLGIALAVFSIPASLRTLIVVQRKRSLGKPVTPTNKVFLFLGSLGTTLVITVVTLCVAWFTFIGSCLLSYSISKGSSESMMVIAGIAALVVTGWVLWGFSYWIRYRWRRDTKS